MYKEKTENIEIYFICYKKEETNLIETYYDEILDINYWYFNAYLAYNYWKNKFKGLKVKKLVKTILIEAASKYILYELENNPNCDYETLHHDLNKINNYLKNILKKYH